MRPYGSLLSLATCSCLSYGALAFLPHTNTARWSSSVTFSSRYGNSSGGPHLGCGQRRSDQRHVLHASSSSNWFSQASTGRTRMRYMFRYFTLLLALDFCESRSRCHHVAPAPWGDEVYTSPLAVPLLWYNYLFEFWKDFVFSPAIYYCTNHQYYSLF